MYLSNAGTGGSQYPKWITFSIEEIMRYLGVYIANGLTPSTQMTKNFSTQSKEPIYGNDFIASAFGTNTLRRHRDFEAFLVIMEPSQITPPRKTHPN